MSVYDTVENIQIKCTPEPSNRHYNIGDNIPLESRLYLGNEGWFIVEQGKVMASGGKIQNKWGDSLIPSEIIASQNPVNIAINNSKET